MVLTCCCCGDGAPAKKQWWNRDNGYGLCGSCADWIKSRPDYNAEEFRSYYGDEGVHWMPNLKETDNKVFYPPQPTPPPELCHWCGEREAKARINDKWNVCSPCLNELLVERERILLHVSRVSRCEITALDENS